MRSLLSVEIMASRTNTVTSKGFWRMEDPDSKRPVPRAPSAAAVTGRPLSVAANDWIDLKQKLAEGGPDELTQRRLSTLGQQQGRDPGSILPPDTRPIAFGHPAPKRHKPEILRMSYCSTWLTDGKPSNLPETIRRLARSCWLKNQKNHITAALLSMGSHLVQTFEGPSEIVRDTFQRIKNDCRHTDVVLLDEQFFHARLFSGFPMVLVERPGSYRMRSLRPGSGAGGAVSCEMLIELLRDQVRPL